MNQKIPMFLGLMLLLVATYGGAEEEKSLSPGEGVSMTQWVLDGEGRISDEEWDRLFVTCDDFEQMESVCISEVDAVPSEPHRPDRTDVVSELGGDADDRGEEIQFSRSPGGWPFQGHLASDVGFVTGDSPRSRP